MTYNQPNLRISDQAYDTLKELPTQLDYADSHNIARFLRDCAKVGAIWRDNRPDYAKSSPGVQAWHDSSLKRYRCLGDLPADYLLEVAALHKIEPYNMQIRAKAGLQDSKVAPYAILRMLGMQRTHTVNARITPVLEAIGLRWLVLDDVSVLQPPPRIRDDGTSRRPRKPRSRKVLVGFA